MTQNTSFFARIKAYSNSRSIRSRIFSYFLFFTGLLLVLLWVFQILLLDDFYKYQKTNMLTSSAETIAQNIENSDLSTLINHISKENDICVLIVNQRMQTLISAEAAPDCVLHTMRRQDLFRSMRAMEDNDEIILHIFPMQSLNTYSYNEARFTGRITTSKNENMKSMIAARRVFLSDGQKIYIFLNAVITPVNATVETLRTQLVFITVILVLLSFLISLMLTRRITQPIEKTTLAAKSLSNGEFTPIPTRISYREVAQLNQQLTQAARDLHKVEVMQQELIANISHDLRTPLTLMEGYAEVMRDLPGENTPENMQVIIDETKRLTTLVNSVLDYSATKSKAYQISSQRFDLTEGILNILQRYQKLTKQDGYQIHFAPHEHIVVCADELQISQIIYNLINNALTYTGEDKTVTVTQTLEPTYVKIEISDTGDGIPAEELPHIWNRYYRGSKPHKRAAVGTGLGLSIVKGILDSHALPYGVDSQPGAGTTFWFSLPLDNHTNG